MPCGFSPIDKDNTNKGQNSGSHQLYCERLMNSRSPDQLYKKFSVYYPGVRMPPAAAGYLSSPSA
jgi:hypothetical protein